MVAQNVSFPDSAVTERSSDFYSSFTSTSQKSLGCSQGGDFAFPMVYVVYLA